MWIVMLHSVKGGNDDYLPLVIEMVCCSIASWIATWSWGSIYNHDGGGGDDDNDDVDDDDDDGNRWW